MPLDRDLTGRTLERRVADLFRAAGDSVQHDVSVAGNQIDVLVEKRVGHGLVQRIAVEAKDRKSVVGKRIVGEFYDLVDRLRRSSLVHAGGIVSASGFSRSAREAAAAHGIHLWELEDLEREVDQGQPASASPGDTVPSAPRPYIAHPNPLPAPWVGRRAELDALNDWLRSPMEPVCCLVAIGGAGKSSLMWHWLQNEIVPAIEILRLEGIVQWSFYRGELSFQEFTRATSQYLRLAGSEDQIAAISRRLAERRYLFVLDGFEWLLETYGTEDEPSDKSRRCSDWLTSRFLHSLLVQCSSKVLIGTRLVPEELDDHQGWRRMDLGGLDGDDAIELLRQRKILGASHELYEAAKQYAFHPQSLTKLASFLQYDIEASRDIRNAPKYDVTPELKNRRRHILELAHDAVPGDLRSFLGALSALHGEARPETIRLLADEAWTERRIQKSLQYLHENEWISWDSRRASLDFHPVVRRFVYGRLAEKTDVHDRLARHFAELVQLDQDPSVEAVAELRAVIEWYHHTLRAGRLDEAYDIFSTRLSEELYHRVCAYRTCGDLLRDLLEANKTSDVPLAQPRVVRLLTARAKCFTRMGRTREALALFEAARELAEQCDDRRGALVALGYLARRPRLALGEIRRAEEELVEKVESARSEGFEHDEAIGHRQLAWVLCHQGSYEDAEAHLADALHVFEARGDDENQSVVWNTRALAALMQHDSATALDAAERARKLANTNGIEASIIRSEWLWGAGYVLRATEVEGADRETSLVRAQDHLTDALTRCRRIRMMTHEPDILGSLARVDALRGCLDAARDKLEEAESVAERCEFMLKRANLLVERGEIELEAGDAARSTANARAALKLLHREDPADRFEPALRRARALVAPPAGV
jgi:tetratricopeptide (TPR) repeat protein